MPNRHSIAQNPYHLFYTKANVYEHWFADHAQGEHDGVDQAAAKPALRRQPHTLTQLMKMFYQLLTTGRYQELIDFLTLMYRKAIVGNELAQAFYRRFNKMLTQDNGVFHRIQAHAGVRQLVDWQLHQLGEQGMVQHVNSTAALPVLRPDCSTRGG